jgi:hypothetical protein
LLVAGKATFCLVSTRAHFYLRRNTVNTAVIKVVEQMVEHSDPQIIELMSYELLLAGGGQGEVLLG